MLGRHPKSLVAADGEKFKSTSFQLLPNPDDPTDLRVTCANRRCDFSRGNRLPILAVDEPIYRRLPCFLIATVDKFAAMPWTGEVGAFFGRVDRVDSEGFYGPCRNGHIGDINWYEFVHGGATDCRRQMWIEEGGTSGDLSEVWVRCECGKGERSMAQAAEHR